MSNYTTVKTDMDRQIGVLNKLDALIEEYKKSDGQQDMVKPLEAYVNGMRKACNAAIDMAKFLEKKEAPEKEKVVPNKPKKEKTAQKPKNEEPEDDDLSFLD